jgi:hypothetical protein
LNEDIDTRSDDGGCRKQGESDATYRIASIAWVILDMIK